METIMEVPEGGHEIPGFILAVGDGMSWFTQYGDVTTEFRDRGVWPTVAEANEARDRFCV